MRHDLATLRERLRRFRRPAAGARVAGPAGAAGAVGAVGDDRDATIARLEQTLTAEREHSASLTKRIEALEFRLEVQERGYTTQLVDSRQLTTEANARVEERQAALDALTQQHEATLRTLSDVRARLERLKSGQAARTWRPDENGHTARPGDDDNTINALLTAAVAPETDARRNALRATDERVTAPADLIDPQLVFVADPDGDD